MHVLSRIQDRRGFALEATLFVLLLMSTVIAVAYYGAVTVQRTANLDYRGSRVFYASEAGAEAVMAQLADALEDGSLSDQELDAIQPPSLPGFTFDALDVERVGGIATETITDGPFAGLYSLTQRVNITAEASDQVDNTSAIVVSVKAQAIPIFQFGIFYEKDLEATNGPSMEFAGWVHSNGNIYLSSNNAWYRDVITTPNKVFHDRKDNHDVKNGVFINDAAANEVRLDFDSRTHPAPDDFRSQSDTKFDNRLKTDAYGVDSLKVPLPDGMDPKEVLKPRVAGDGELEKKAKYAWKADWYIEVPMNLVTAGVMPCDAMVQTRAAGLSVPGAAACAAIFEGAGTAWEAFYDGREEGWVDVFEVDMEQLRNWVNTNPGTNGTSIMYITFTGAGASTPATDPSGDGLRPVVRLSAGFDLHGPFSFATDRPLYVLGDYNTVSWNPAAVVGDAIMILSNAWTDAAHRIVPFPMTNAANTSVYAAILAGHSPTPCDHENVGCAGGYTDFYGGGIENFPRFLENWGGRTLLYRGSLVSLHYSEYAVGTWNGTYYSPPVRDWQFDTRFRDPANLPPGTPTVGNVIRMAFRPIY